MKNSRKSNKKYLIILLIVFILALAIGYAAFTDVLQISGTANANGTFDLEFQNASIASTIGCDDVGTTVEISEDKDTLTVNVQDLAYPGAGAQISFDIVNVGSIPARISQVTTNGLEGSDHIKIEGLDVLEQSHPTIAANGTCSVSFTVQWDPEATTELTEEEKSGISFSVEVEYTQDTNSSSSISGPSHSDS